MRDLILNKLQKVFDDCDGSLQLEYFHNGVEITDFQFFISLSDEELLEAFEDVVGFNG